MGRSFLARRSMNSMTAPVAEVADPLSEACALRPLIEAEADAANRDLTLTEPLVEAFTRTQLFHVMVPKELGGLEADSDTLLDVFEELSCADGSVGWTLMVRTRLR